MIKRYSFGCILLCAIAIIVFASCDNTEQIVLNEEAQKDDKVIEVNLPDVLKDSDTNISGCLWYDDDTLVIGKNYYSEGLNEAYSYHIPSEQVNMLTEDFPQNGEWDWGECRSIRTNQRVAFACNSLVTFDSTDINDISIVRRNGYNEYCYSPDLKYVAIIRDFETDTDEEPKEGVSLILRNLENEEEIVLDRSIITPGIGLSAADLYWSFDSSSFAYLIDFEHILMYDIASGESQRINLNELVRNEDENFYEFYRLMYSISGDLHIIANHKSGWVIARYNPNYKDMDWQQFALIYPPFRYVGESDDKIYVINTEPGNVEIVSYADDLSDYREVFSKPGEYVSSAGLSPDGSKLAVFTYTPDTLEKHFYLVDVM